MSKVRFRMTAVALVLALGAACCARGVLAAPLDLTTAQWAVAFDHEVDDRMAVPPVDQARYIILLEQALADAKLEAPGQVVILIDRSPQVQAALIVMHSDSDEWLLIGATAVSTHALPDTDKNAQAIAAREQAEREDSGRAPQKRWPEAAPRRLLNAA